MRAVVTSDWQIPYHDTRACRAVIEYTRAIRPDKFIVLGDMFDLSQLSTKFLRKRSDPDELLGQIDCGRAYMEEIRELVGEIVFIAGNHEDRLTNYIVERAPELQGFAEEGEALSISGLMGPGVRYVGPWGSAYIVRSFVFKHGDMTGQFAAHKELLMEGSSGMSGHLHRFQSAAHTDRSGEHGWWSIGCLCHIGGPTMPPAVHEGQNRLQNWQQGFATVTWVGDLFHVANIVVHDGHFVGPDGRLWGPGGEV